MSVIKIFQFLNLKLYGPFIMEEKKNKYNNKIL